MPGGSSPGPTGTGRRTARDRLRKLTTFPASLATTGHRNVHHRRGDSFDFRKPLSDAGEHQQPRPDRPGAVIHRIKNGGNHRGYCGTDHALLRSCRYTMCTPLET